VRNKEPGPAHSPKQSPPTGPLGEALAPLRVWEADWTEAFQRMTTDPWTNGILPLATVELICIAINAACTNLQVEATRRHIRAALAAGASRDEILMVVKMASLLSIHSCSLGAPILLEEAKAANVRPSRRAVDASAPVCDRLRATGQWNDAWTPFYDLDPSWTEQFMAVGIPVYAGGVLSPKLAELLSIAFDASFTHMYAPGIRRHIKAALAHGATVDEIHEVLKLCVIQGVEAANLAVPILAEELTRVADDDRSAKARS
jgi:alkylhydroperoxidase/carboxymuconolactone decarboxylase family protein YurZ